MRIKPKNTKSKNRFKSSLFGYYRQKFGSLGRVQKEERPFDADFTPGLHQLPDSVQYTVSNLIKESISEKLRQHASKEVASYIKSQNGSSLMNRVREILRGKRASKKV